MDEPVEFGLFSEVVKNKNIEVAIDLLNQSSYLRDHINKTENKTLLGEYNKLVTQKFVQAVNRSDLGLANKIKTANEDLIANFLSTKTYLQILYNKLVQQPNNVPSKSGDNSVNFPGTPTSPDFRNLPLKSSANPSFELSDPLIFAKLFANTCHTSPSNTRFDLTYNNSPICCFKVTTSSENFPWCYPLSGNKSSNDGPGQQSQISTDKVLSYHEFGLQLANYKDDEIHLMIRTILRIMRVASRNDPTTSKSNDLTIDLLKKIAQIPNPDSGFCYPPIELVGQLLGAAACEAGRGKTGYLNMLATFIRIKLYRSDPSSPNNISLQKFICSNIFPEGYKNPELDILRSAPGFLGSQECIKNFSIFLKDKPYLEIEIQNHPNEWSQRYHSMLIRDIDFLKSENSMSQVKQEKNSKQEETHEQRYKRKFLRHFEATQNPGSKAKTSTPLKKVVVMHRKNPQKIPAPPSSEVNVNPTPPQQSSSMPLEPQPLERKVAQDESEKNRQNEGSSVLKSQEVHQEIASAVQIPQSNDQSKKRPRSDDQAKSDEQPPGAAVKKQKLEKEDDEVNNTLPNETAVTAHNIGETTSAPQSKKPSPTKQKKATYQLSSGSNCKPPEEKSRSSDDRDPPSGDSGFPFNSSGANLNQGTPSIQTTEKASNPQMTGQSSGNQSGQRDMHESSPSSTQHQLAFEHPKPAPVHKDNVESMNEADILKIQQTHHPHDNILQYQDREKFMEAKVGECNSFDDLLLYFRSLPHDMGIHCKVNGLISVHTIIQDLEKLSKDAACSTSCLPTSYGIKDKVDSIRNPSDKIIYRA